MKTLLAITAATTALYASTAQATLIYGFETGTVASPDGFAPAGLGAAVAQATGVGVTQGTSALSFTASLPATFVAARNETNLPAALSDTAQTALNVDITLPAALPPTGIAGFASLVVTYFGRTNEASPQYGIQVQLPDFVALEGRAAGTFTDTFDLVAASPFTGTSSPLFNGPNAIFGTGAEQLTLTGFQFVINKSNTFPATVLLDNVQNNVVPEPASLGLLALAGTLITRRRRA